MMSIRIIEAATSTCDFSEYYHQPVEIAMWFMDILGLFIVSIDST